MAIAKDLYEQTMTMRKLIFVGGFLLFFNFLNAQSGNDYALFFVVTDFDHWQPFPASSAQQVDSIAKELKEVYDFEVEVVPNPTRSQILKKLNSYQKRRFQANDQLLIYFSTHGQYEEGGTGALIPKNGKLEDPTLDSWIYHPLLADQINKIPCQHILLALDACYSGTFGPKYRNKPEKPVWEAKKDCQEKKQSALKHKSRLYLTSGGAERTPTDSDFAKKWLEALRLRNTDGVLGFHELYAVLNEATNPKPMFGDFRSHVQGGGFVFLNSKQCAPSEKMTDVAHWRSLNGNTQREILLDHLQQYPNCIHQMEVFQLLSDDTELDPIIPSGMIYIKGGTFQMGSADGGSDEKPVHQVTLSDYYIGKYEVTVREFSQFMEASDYKTDAEKGGGSYIWDGSDWLSKVGVNWRHDVVGKLRLASEYDHPVIHVSWNDAIAYCNWLSELQQLTPVYVINGDKVVANWQANGYRLPTEAEWEYAARSRGQSDKWAGTSTESRLHEFANYSGTADGFAQTAPVGSLKANGTGLFDMSGNVYEWCWDLYDGYDPSAQTNPHGPKSGSNRVIRGGSWDIGPADLRCANRKRYLPGRRYYAIGFRLSRAVP